MKTEYRQDELTALGITSDRLAAVYSEIRERETLAREWKWNIRGTAASMFGGTVRQLKNRYRRAFNGGDMTNIPGFDSMAQELASWFPELAGEDQCQRLFDLLSESVDRVPTAEASYCEAIDTVLEDVRVTEYDHSTTY